MTTNYWLVGATWGGSKDVLPKFLQRGYWYCWDANKFENEEAGVGNSIKNQQERFTHVKTGDRIAVKRLLGKGSSEMAILAIGKVKDVDISEWRIYVDWIISDIKDRNVPLRGCAASIHGPFSKLGKDEEWIQKIFCL
ncbi:hypothetical protein BK675_01640 [Pseudomonas fluorescens]|jgi:hypothetical protein|uniref:Uncharacterized protein n=1 Tax=Pseudomonas triticicola TaxID=2842345 RepID=A0ABS6RHI7_9PSED|nr:glycyl-tRNA synthetase subunit alpha [Pseudomonas triticicola]MBV4545593.1 hypothetical protein [Pseudomonas triticicola]RON75326.1 hypothetical protein BK677_06340 [Pseudomonas fluorescens]ROO11393.1 hypothetical protein BK675_01640 [Pseudomonas fluorescens]ROO19705.1 hypothetical protein BK676_03670 [Pseudomonas fluorescens]